MSSLIICFVRLSQIWGSYLNCSSFLIANNANESKRNRSQGVCVLLLWWQEQLPNQESYCDKVVGVAFASAEQWSVRNAGGVKGRNVIKTCESEGWGHECHGGNRTNSLLCLTTESDKLTHTSASLFSSLPLFSPLSLLEPVCFDSALYLYFKWLNYVESCSENYGCFPLFLSAGTQWPHQGSNKAPSSFFPSISFYPPVFFPTLSLSAALFFFFFLINILLPAFSATDRK